MDNQELHNIESSISTPKATTSAHVVTANSVQAEEVPTIPIESLQTIHTLQPEVSIHPVTATQTVSVSRPLVAQPTEYQRTLSEWIQVWWDGIRPAYLLLPLLPVLVGSVFAWTQTVSQKSPLGHFHWTHFIVILAAIVLLQAGTNLINDYYDFLRGTDKMNSFGSSDLIRQRLVEPSHLLTCGLFSLGIGAVLGAVAALQGGPLVFVLGAIGLLCGYFYSATKRSLSSLTLGELVNFWIFGPFITLGAYLIQTGGVIDRSVILYSLPLGLFAAAVTHINNMRDVEGDMHAGKRTIATLLALRWNRTIFLLLLLAAYAIVIVAALPHGASHWLLITLWTLPSLTVIVTGFVRTDTPAGLHLTMHKTIRLETYFVLLLVVALIITALVPLIPHIPTHFLPV
jgi:1,4-dihydroxy-2-naphthoate polyprenyltransferase